MCDVLSTMLGYEACIVNVMLAWGARMLGMLSCAVSLLGCRVRGLESEDDASLGARLHGVLSCAMSCLQC